MFQVDAGRSAPNVVTVEDARRWKDPNQGALKPVEVVEWDALRVVRQQKRACTGSAAIVDFKHEILAVGWPR